MKKLYDIYTENVKREGCLTEEYRSKLPIDYAYWCANLIIVREKSKENNKSYIDTCLYFTELFLNISRSDLLNMNFDPYQDSGGINMRNYLGNNNELIDNFNKILSFLK